MNKEQQELLDDTYECYSESHWSPPSNPNGKLLSDQLWSLKPMEHSKETFINKCKTDTEFSERWGLKIEERDLSLEERYRLAGIFGKEKLPSEPYYTDEQQHSLLDELAPTRLITITYNNETIESYEN